MCSFTHSGLLQILSRYKDGEIGEITANYTAESKVQLLRISSQLIFLMAVFYLEDSGLKDAAD
jgi:hypothetical protein